MRLTCPNCGAHYEVADDVIPENGRDVQCSSCGNTWFQRSPHNRDATRVAADDRDSVAEAETQSPEKPTEPETPDPTDVQHPDPEQNDGESEKPGLDQGVTDILRSEAERETAERAQESDEKPVKDDTITNITKTIEQEKTDQVDVDMSDTSEAARSGLLPDIEEINSTLASDTIEEPEVPEPIEIQSRNGFRRGFVWAVIVFAILALIYVFARQIADAVPQIAPALSSYVDWVNALRAAVDSMMLNAVDKLTGLLSQLDAGSES